MKVKLSRSNFMGSDLANSLHTRIIPELLNNSEMQLAGYGVAFYQHFNGINESIFNSDNSLNKSLACVKDYLKNVLTGLELAHPQLLVKKYFFFQRWLMLDKQDQNSFKHGVELIQSDTQLVRSSVRFLELESKKLKQMMNEIEAHKPSIKCFIDEGLLFLKEKKLESGEYDTSTLDWFSRQVLNLSTFYTQLTIAENQIKYIIQNIEFLIEKYLEIERLILPIWKSNIYFQSYLNVNNEQISHLIHLRNRMLKELI